MHGSRNKDLTTGVVLIQVRKARRSCHGAANRFHVQKSLNDWVDAKRRRNTDNVRLRDGRAYGRFTHLFCFLPVELLQKGGNFKGGEKSVIYIKARHPRIHRSVGRFTFPKWRRFVGSSAACPQYPGRQSGGRGPRGALVSRRRAALRAGRAHVLCGRKSGASRGFES